MCTFASIAGVCVEVIWTLRHCHFVDHSSQVGKWFMAILVYKGHSEEGSSTLLQVWYISPPMSPSQWAVVLGRQK